MESNRSEDCRSQSRWKTKGRVFAASYDLYKQTERRFHGQLWHVINVIEDILWLLMTIITELYSVDPMQSCNIYK